jgi:hypothetical protein
VNGDRCPGPGAGHAGRDAVPALIVEELRAVARCRADRRRDPARAFGALASLARRRDNTVGRQPDPPALPAADWERHHPGAWDHFGHVSRGQARRKGLEPSGVAAAGCVLGYVFTAIAVIAIIAIAVAAAHAGSAPCDASNPNWPYC